MTSPASLADRFPIISEQMTREDIRLVLSELAATLQKPTPGAIVEFGCYIGTTSLFVRRLLDEMSPLNSRQFYVYDSFAGLPPKEIADASIAGEGFKAGELSITKRQFLREFKRAGLQPPVVHKGWFDQLEPMDIPEPIAFAFLDGDFYQSILSALRLVWPKMSSGGTVLIDDYSREALPGVERAVRDFFRLKTLPAIRTSQDIAILSVP